ncbi:MAG: TIGR03905 family TSCPD domain-containing protein [Muribaculaceae bacterium]|nr:TIGR03905 family TSCPD domain-containing protein [Muribaculaceae bacterium]
MAHITYFPQGTCSQQMDIEVENGRVKQAFVMGGCSGNLQGICSLVRDMPVDEVIARLEGIRCGYKSTSCPDQLAQALKQAKAKGL